MMRRIAGLFLLSLALIAAPAWAQTFPPLTGRVVDAADIIPPAEEARLAADLETFEREKGQQFVVATIPSLEGHSIEDYGYRLGRAWGIGRFKVDDGVILIVAPNERKVRIEVGYGLTPMLTAGYAGAVIADDITPRFKDGDLPGGIRAGADAIMTQLRLPAPQAEARAKRILAEREQRNAGADGTDWLIILFWGAVLLFIVIPMLLRRKGGRRYRGGSGPVVIWGPGGGGWGSGSSDSNWGSSNWGGGGGGFSGGGGSFGGGGASGSW